MAQVNEYSYMQLGRLFGKITEIQGVEMDVLRQQDHALATKAVTRHKDLTRLMTERGAVGLDGHVIDYGRTLADLAGKYDVPHSVHEIVSQNGHPLLEAISKN